MSILTDFDKLLTSAVASPDQRIISLDIAAAVLGFRSYATAYGAARLLASGSWTEVKTLCSKTSQSLSSDTEIMLNFHGLKDLCLHEGAKGGREWREKCLKVETAQNIEKILKVIETGTATEQANARGLIVEALSEVPSLRNQVKDLETSLALTTNLNATLKRQNTSLSNKTFELERQSINTHVPQKRTTKRKTAKT